MKTSYETITKKVMKDIFSKLHELHNDLPFLPERMKIEKVKKLVNNLHDKTKDVTLIKSSWSD